MRALILATLLLALPATAELLPYKNLDPQNDTLQQLVMDLSACSTLALEPVSIARAEMDARLEERRVDPDADPLALHRAMDELTRAGDDMERLTDDCMQKRGWMKLACPPW